MRIAITGGVAEGKSTVLGYLREMGYATVSSDVLARHVFAAEATQEALGALLGVPPPIPPERLREAISGSHTVRRAVNRITHPLILAAIAGEEAPFFEVPLLVETCLYGFFDRVWVVTCGPEEQLRRLTLRMGSEEEASAFLRTQLPTQVKCAFADEIIRTNPSEEIVNSLVRTTVTREFGRLS